MKKSRFTEEQIAYALKQVELGMSVGEVCRKMGIAEATFYVWRKKYVGWDHPSSSVCGCWKRKIASSSSWWPT
ncbi:hypothetical protein LMG31886_10820 [Xanthomonas hydrangeae]|nr:hypothetical protein LMG31884_11800 [Xanthomonas hydrangeae]CAD7714551.1 hypothetical protein LMG31884_11800 [Xanthomonas hydrangeae]CAD7722515.1 hypothetical protein LMG31885_04670 [Xanthomonas hydrangeae]CAD7722519.1 hypothetical protein LMG31885_04670 [Xanthomonas hydrangeae]CAD7724233.1 hypothetical protein LMG31887_11810 [Xanthomonas hydrangeae]